MESLSDKLKALGIRQGAGNPAGRPVPDEKQSSGVQFPIQSVVQGFDLNTAYGTAFIAEQIFPEEHQQGTVALKAARQLNYPGAMGQDPQCIDRRVG